jgi:hypothetical protein
MHGVLPIHRPGLVFTFLAACVPLAAQNKPGAPAPGPGSGTPGPVPAAGQPAPPAGTGRPEASTRLEAGRPAGGGSAARTAGESAYIHEPSQGRPIFITPGESFYFVMRLPADLKGEVSFYIRHVVEPGVRVNLQPKTPPSYKGEYCSLVLLVPPGVEPGLYDLEVAARDTTLHSRHSIRVVESFKTRFRFVHLSNMNIGDLTAPHFDDTLPREINLLAPEFIVATGDYTEWARARDDAASWSRVLRYFELFHAPVFLLCGLHDHEASFTRYVASDPIGTIDYGAYHGLLLLDHPGNPIDQDHGQLRWVETDLRRNRQKRMNFLASNSDELALLDIWQEKGNLAEFLREHKVRMFLVGGSSDWDFREFADKLKGAGDLAYIRTHQASTCLRDRATGVSHYRVIEVDGDKLAYVYPDDTAGESLLHSIPSGRLRTFFDTPNDGTASRVTVTVQNSLNQAFNDARVWLRLAKGTDGQRPVVAPGRIVQAIDAGRYWACDVALNLPDKGAVRLMASANPDDIPPALPIEVDLEGSRVWSFSPASTPFGLSYHHGDTPVSLKLTNRARSPLSCWPVISVNGAQLQPDRKAVPRLPLTLDPGKTTIVPLVLDVRRVSPGRHALQVHFLEDPLSRLTTFEVEMVQSQ